MMETQAKRPLRAPITVGDAVEALMIERRAQMLIWWRVRQRGWTQDQYLKFVATGETPQAAS